MRLYYLRIIVVLVCGLANITHAANRSVLTSSERELLHKRAQTHDTTVITVASPKQRSLLQSPSRSIDAQSPDLNNLIEQMRRTVIAHHGLGITAVQLGIPVRVLLLERLANDGTKKFHVFLNPEPLQISSDKIELWERCLSLPNAPNHLMQRATQLSIRYQTLDGQMVNEDLHGVEAGIFQQELDHLNGILLSDYHVQGWSPLSQKHKP